MHVGAEELQEHPQAVCRVCIVIDHQNPAHRRESRLGARAGTAAFGRTRIGLSNRKPYREFAALPKPVAMNLDATAVHGDEPLHQIEADAQAILGAAEPTIYL